MSPKLCIVLMALFALGGSSLASAEEPSPKPNSDAAAMASLADLSLDSAFEDATSPKSDPRAGVLPGPTSMDCRSGENVEGPETCVVTADDMLAAMPAALATH